MEKPKYNSKLKSKPKLGYKPKYNPGFSTMYEVYNLVYDFGDLTCEEAVVSSTSPERAEELLANHLFDKFLEGEDGKNIDFLVRATFPTGVKANKEKVFSPKVPSDLEITLAAMATQTELRT